MSSIEIGEGVFVLPKRLSLAVVIAAVTSLISLVVMAANTQSRIDALEATDRRLVERDQEFAKQFEALGGLRDRLARIEEQVRASNDVLKEIRADLRGPPRR